MQMLMRAARRSGIAWALAVGLATTASAAADLGPSLQAFLAKAAETAPAVKGDTSGPELLAFYQERNFQPIWLDGAKASKKARDLIEILSSARADGLEPADYATARLKGMVEAASGTDPAQLESLLSFAAVHYGNDLAAGRVDPSTIDDEIQQHPEKIPPGKLIRDVAAAADLKAFFASLPPQTVNYRRLRDALAQYRVIAEKGGFVPVQAGEPIKPGASDPRVPVLRERLAQSGLQTTPAGDPATYDSALEQAVRTFQQRHGLPLDGTIGKKTFEALNVPIERRIEQMVMNLERRRWLPDDLGERYVFVNMADFELKVVDGAHTIHTTRVVVGTPFHRTPVFSDSIKYVELNPFWNVTPSIASKELLPKLKRDPGYLGKNGYRLFSGWGAGASEVDPHSVDWSQVSASHFTYKIRQDPGPKNSLGQIKFVFPNTQNIYLHDTPSRQLFQETMRAFSHGCIRVQNPVDLAVVLLKDKDGEGWTKEKLTQVIASGEQKTITLPKPLPVHLVYLTAWVNKDGSVNFRDDIYGRDNRLAEGLKRARHMING